MIYDTNNLRIHHRTQATMSLLESFERISREFTRPSPFTTPLVEAINYGGSYMVRYSDLIKLCEEYEISVQEAINEVVEAHQLQPHEVIVSLEEWRAYDDPYILYRFSNEYVVVPEYDTLAYNFCEMCMDAFCESNDESWIDIFIEADQATAEYHYEKYQRQRANYEAQLKKVQAMKQSDPQYEKQNQILFGMQKAMEKTKNLAALATTSIDSEEGRAERRQIDSASNDPNQSQWRQEGYKKRQEKFNNIVSAERKKEIIKNAKANAHAVGDISSKNNSSTNNVSNNDQEQGWFSRKWAAFKNWWNNAGQQKEGEGGGWFSNLIGKIKSGLGLGNFNASPASTAPTPSATATNPAPANPAPNETKEQKEARVEQQKTQTEEKKQEQKVDNKPPASGTPATVQNQKTT